MTKVSYLLLLSAIVFSACNTAEYKKAKADGSEYKIISTKSGKLVTNGNVIEMNIIVKYKDSLIFSTVESGMPEFAPYDTSKLPPVYKEIFKTIHVGDSVVIRTSTDSLMKMGQAGPFMKKGQFVFQSYKIVNSFASQQDAATARAEAMAGANKIAKAKEEEQKKKDDKIIQDYFAKNGIKATKAPLGTYVQIITPGTGNNIDTNVVVKTNYTGRTLDGKMFDSNTDSSKGHVEPFNVNMTSDRTIGRYTIAGWKDGLQLLNKGAKAKFYIPSSLAYGPQSPSPEIPANAVLEFDIEVLDILNRDQAKLEAEKQSLKQKAFMDSVRKARKEMKPDTTHHKN